MLIKINDDVSQEIRWKKIKSIRDDITENGGCLVEGKWFHSDTKSKQQQISLMLMGANIPDGIMWKTMDGSFVEMTCSLATALFSKQIEREQLIYSFAEHLRANINSDITQGWPQRYGS